MKKHEERAIEILIQHYGCTNEEDLKKCFLSNNESYIMMIEAMCQLAEEVEKECTLFVKLYHSELQKGNLYTKEQVEGLLQKQRELCYNEAELDGSLYSDTHIVKDSILNAKLNIE